MAGVIVNNRMHPAYAGGAPASTGSTGRSVGVRLPLIRLAVAAALVTAPWTIPAAVNANAHLPHRIGQAWQRSYDSGVRVGQDVRATAGAVIDQAQRNVRKVEGVS